MPVLSLEKKVFRNKGGLLVLFWSFGGFLFFIYCLKAGYIDLTMCFLASLVFYPIAGWLTDVYFGRCKVVRISMWITFFMILAYNLVLVVRVFCPKYAHGKIFKCVDTVIGAVGLLSFSGFQANALHFGMDQFVDASSMEITAYINWYVWIILLSRCLINISQVEGCCDKYHIKLIIIFAISFFWTLVVISDIFLSHWLVKEPVVRNPLKLIVQVCKYAAKNKYPRLRSSFYFWDKNTHSRLDLGKAKFGGPFTSDQVDDVKTFFRILLIIFVVSCILALGFILVTSFKYLIMHYKNAHSEYCYVQLVEEEIPNLVVVASIPIFELFFYPWIRKCTWCAKVSILQRFLFGIFLVILYELHIVSVEAVSSFSGQNHNDTCTLNFKNFTPVAQGPTYYNWLIWSNLFSVSAMYFLFTSAITFIYAQTPYSMKGLLSGIAYCLSGITSAIATFFWDETFKRHSLKSIHNSKYCGVGFYGISLVVTAFLLIIGIWFTKKYKLRERDEEHPYQQISEVDVLNRYE